MILDFSLWMKKNFFKFKIGRFTTIIPSLLGHLFATLDFQDAIFLIVTKTSQNKSLLHDEPGELTTEVLPIWPLNSQGVFTNIPVIMAHK